MSQDTPDTAFDLSPTELLRRMNNIVRFGTVAEVKLTKPARVRVKSGDLLTDWLVWSTVRAAKASVWWPPTVGEQVLLLSPGGDPAQAMVLPACYSDANPQCSESAHEMRIQFDNGDTFVHNSQTGSLAANIKKTIGLVAGDSISLSADKSITLSAAGTTLNVATGKVTVNNDVVAGGISLVNHPHDKTQPGLGMSGKPVAS